MKVKELIELLKQQPEDAEILIDCRHIDDVEIYSQSDWYAGEEEIIVVHINT
jgi:hypothetical protein